MEQAWLRGADDGCEAGISCSPLRSRRLLTLPGLAAIVEAPETGRGECGVKILYRRSTRHKTSPVADWPGGRRCVLYRRVKSRALASRESSMSRNTHAHGAAETSGSAWLRYSVLALILEKIFQHIVVTLAFLFDWGAIRSTVVVHPDILLVLGAIVAVLFGLSLWGMLRRKPWALTLVIGLAIFDIIGEFVAQGTISIMLTVSFLVATLLLILALWYRRYEGRTLP
jgi:hypothetical protein